VKWKEISLNLQDFPTTDFTTPPLVIFVAVTEGETSVTSSPSFVSPNTQPFPFSPRRKNPVSPVQTPSPPGSPLVHVQMAGANLPRNMMDEILTTRYAPLVLRQPMNSLTTTDNLKYMPWLEECAWYRDIIFFLLNMQPPDGMEKRKVRDLKLRSIKYCLIDQVLYWKYRLGVPLRCLDPQEAQKIMFEFHDSLCGGHHF
jgi:hypothetical protein